MQARFPFLQQAGHVKGQVRPVAIDGKLLGMQHHLLAHPLGVLPPEIVERHGSVVLRRLGLDGADAQFSRSVSERLRDQEVYLARTRPRAIFLAGLFFFCLPWSGRLFCRQFLSRRLFSSRHEMAEKENRRGRVFSNAFSRRALYSLCRRHDGFLALCLANRHKLSSAPARTLRTARKRRMDVRDLCREIFGISAGIGAALLEGRFSDRAITAM